MLIGMLVSCSHGRANKIAEEMDTRREEKRREEKRRERREEKRREEKRREEKRREEKRREEKRREEKRREEKRREEKRKRRETRRDETRQESVVRVVYVVWPVYVMVVVPLTFHNVSSVFASRCSFKYCFAC